MANGQSTHLRVTIPPMRALGLWLSAVALCALLVGCRTKEAPAAPPAPRQDAQLEIWNLFDPLKAFEGAFQQFQSQNPGVKISYRTFADAELYEAELINAMAEGRAPDIIAIQDDWLPRHQAKLSPAPTRLVPAQAFEEEFLPVATELLVRSVRTEEGEVERRVFGIPLFVDTLGVYFNAALLRDGLANAAAPAETWEELENQVALLSRPDNSVERYAVSGAAIGRVGNISLGAELLLSLLLQQGVSMWNADGRSTFAGAGARGEAPAERAIAYFASYANPANRHASWNRLLTALRPDEAEIGAFVRGKTAMMFGFAESRADILAARETAQKAGDSVIDEADIRAAPLPQFAERLDQGRRDTLARMRPLAVTRTSQNPALSWQLLLFLADTPAMQEYQRHTARPASRFALLENDLADPNLGPFARQASSSKWLPLLSFADIRELFVRFVDPVSEGRLSAADAAKQIEEGLNCLRESLENPSLSANCL